MQKEKKRRHQELKSGLKSKRWGYFRSNNTYINAVVYRRRFHLCDMYSVAGKFAYKQKPGSMLAHRPIIETYQELNEEQSDCLSLFERGSTEDGLYTIQPLIALNIQTWCDMKNGGWTVIQRRLDGSENFYRTWTDYVCGFGNRSGEYWLGLENIYRLTTVNSSLRIDMDAFEDVSHIHAYAQYDTFKIDGEDSNFRLHVNGYSGNCGDSLSLHDGNVFSTKDRDNDGWPYNCAQILKGAWCYEAFFVIIAI
ncbi:angiopoietin-related protein 2-like [Ruditapes philippinarum]|uniref:angiopoietin-related protein 2-like n=1 Tax=Ruditapes philippinarum TaxID=129788 RepID=UPI00295BE9ED|nr:angiopoietin-related protein 2-like [Ruditapes philippinarum]